MSSTALTLLLAILCITAGLPVARAAESDFFKDFVDQFPNLMSLDVLPYKSGGADYCKSGYGVTCDGSNKVSVFGFYDVDMSGGGSLPSTISELKSAREISIIGCAMKIDLNHFTSLSNLEILRLYGNQISGAIPSLPDSIIRLYVLPILYFPFLQVVFELTLSSRGLGANQLSELPTKFPSSLVVLSLENNKFSSNLENSNDLFKLSSLEDLHLGDNQFTGTFPSSILSSSTIKILSAHHNKLSGNLPNFTGISNLYKLDVSNNQFEGSIPSDLLTKSSILYLSLKGNKLSGNIPTMTIGSIMYLDISDNNLSGEIPTVNSPRLLVLKASNNPLTGTLSEDTFKNTQLGDGECILSGTQLSGSSSVCSTSGEPSPSPTPTPEPSPSPTPTPEPSPSPTPTPEPSPSPTPTPEPSPSPTPTPEPSPSPTPTPEPSSTSPSDIGLLLTAPHSVLLRLFTYASVLALVHFLV
ncbi:uncharacterized protein LOC126316908 isoform X5 [Schistocerca gregaria]|uniref:uncharacterized protein LOC126316908 isoform X5 n=1 Tax=Schistocerca gregaria TaxID=7010 RepID=UPI00211F332C|nr:uncharacterized protein LOC126316908 isoform X5 [Schistocerca gregaria]